ncbi:lipase family alpha/beta hydrolase [Nocardiopsis halophila]|uniref:lipase family alpha/beta hydrolase n=1 Tax=Nocardiopsis halophila TaxID=141692 RepID=UPI00034A4FC7|nr:alpha/beta fold hydrolase [Nocardiopsis halophila]
MSPRTPPHPLLAAASALAAALLLATAAPAAADTPQAPAPTAAEDGAAAPYGPPELPEPDPAAAAAGEDPWPDAPGANDFDCEPTDDHPRPVVLLHGYGANGFANWQALSPRLALRGYCVFAPTYGLRSELPLPLSAVGGAVPMEESAQELSDYVDRVLEATGAEEVDIVGHSEGSLMPNHYVKFLGGADKVANYVALTPLWDGTRFFGASEVNRIGEEWGLGPTLGRSVDEICGPCRQFLTGSEFLEEMNEGGAAVPGVTYTTVMTKYDFLVQPYTSGFLEGDDVTNIVLQDRCRTDLSGHIGVAFDPVVHRYVFNALDPESARPPLCI